jgi:hypothetical protein
MRMQEALARIRQRAKELGLDQMTNEEIEDEIRRARQERARLTTPSPAAAP